MEWCPLKLIDSPITYGVCLTEEEYRSMLTVNGVSEIEQGEYISKDSTAEVKFFRPGTRNLAIVTFCKNHQTLEFNHLCTVICHEAVHIWQAIKEHIGESNPSDEFEAYSIQRITKNLLDHYERAVLQLQPKRKKSKNGKPVKVDTSTTVAQISGRSYR